MKLERYKEAVEFADAALKADPQLPGAYTLAGIARSRAGDNNGAIDAYKKALRQNPEDFDANLRLGTILIRVEDDPDAAEPYLEKALQFNPASLPARFEIGKVHMARRDDAAAISDFERIVRQNPTLMEPHVQLAVLYGRQKRRQESERERKLADDLKATAAKDDLEP